MQVGCGCEHGIDILHEWMIGRQTDQQFGMALFFLIHHGCQPRGWPASQEFCPIAWKHRRAQVVWLKYTDKTLLLRDQCARQIIAMQHQRRTNPAIDHEG